jgi:putative Mg2+ transporter-C (MgtC) family protein
MQDLSLQNLEILFQLGLAVLLGGAIGLDRERAEKPAGFRTHMLVCASSALLVILGAQIDLRYREIIGADVVRTDPIRVVQTIITGISFIGAGTIMRHKKGAVEGLTTAATLLFAATIGIGVGVGSYLLAIVSTALVVVILVLGIRIENWLGTRN